MTWPGACTPSIYHSVEWKEFYKTSCSGWCRTQIHSAPADLTREQETTMSTEGAGKRFTYSIAKTLTTHSPEGRRGGPLDDPGPIRSGCGASRAPETRSAGCAGGCSSTPHRAPQRLLQGRRDRVHAHVFADREPPHRVLARILPWRSPRSRWSTRRSAPTRSGTSARRPARWVSTWARSHRRRARRRHPQRPSRHRRNPGHRYRWLGALDIGILRGAPGTAGTGTAGGTGQPGSEGTCKCSNTEPGRDGGRGQWRSAAAAACRPRAATRACRA